LAVEHERPSETAVLEASDEHAVVAVAIATSIREGIETATITSETGADLAMATPHYDMPTDLERIEYVRSLGEATDLPLPVYDVIAPR